MLTDCIHRDIRRGHWRSTSETSASGRRYRTVWHYSTAMLTFPIDADGRPDIRPADVIHFSTGHGSVSDQQAMNRLFRSLSLPYYFSRKGGADIRRTDAPSDWADPIPAAPGGRSRLLAN